MVKTALSMHSAPGWVTKIPSTALCHKKKKNNARVEQDNNLEEMDKQTEILVSTNPTNKTAYVLEFPSFFSVCHSIMFHLY